MSVRKLSRCSESGSAGPRHSTLAVHVMAVIAANSLSRHVTQQHNAMRARRRWHVGITCVRAILRMQHRLREPLSKGEREAVLAKYYTASARHDINNFTAIRDLVFSCGQLCQEEELQALLELVGYKAGSLFSLRHFFGVMELRKREFAIDSSSTDTEKAYIALMDANHPEVSIPALLAICEDYALSDEVGRLIEGADEDGSGRIDFDEFKGLLESDDASLVSPVASSAVRSPSMVIRDLSRYGSMLGRRPTGARTMTTTSPEDHPQFMDSFRGERSGTPIGTSPSHQQSVVVQSPETLAALLEPDPRYCVQQERLESKHAAERLTASCDRMKSPRRVTSSTRGFGGSSARFSGEPPIVPMPPPRLKGNVRPLRPHRSEHPLPASARHTTTPFEAQEALANTARSSTLATSRPGTANTSSSLKGSSFTRLGFSSLSSRPSTSSSRRPEFQLSDSSQFNPFLGVPAKEARERPTRADKCAIAPATLVKAAENHQMGDVYLPLICSKIAKKEAARLRRQSRRELEKQSAAA